MRTMGIRWSSNYVLCLATPEVDFSAGLATSRFLPVKPSSIKNDLLPILSVVKTA